MKTRRRRRLSPSSSSSSSSASDDDNGAPTAAVVATTTAVDENFTCPVCLSLMVKPVLLPCSHELCLACLMRASSGDWCSLACPLCRRRLSVWMRRTRNPELLVNTDKWSRIQRLHPALLAGDASPASVAEALANDDDDAEPPRLLARPGELRAEYQAALEVFNAERRAELAAEEAASLALIRRLRLAEATTSSSDISSAAAESTMAEDIALADADIGPDAAEPLAAPPMQRQESDQSMLEARCSAAASYLRCDSVDSIGPELNQHFRPIQAMPLTPTKTTHSATASSATSTASATSTVCRKVVHRPKAKRSGIVRHQRPSFSMATSGGLATLKMAIMGQRRMLLRSASVQEASASPATATRNGKLRLLRNQISVVFESPPETSANLEFDADNKGGGFVGAGASGGVADSGCYGNVCDEASCSRDGRRGGGYCLRKFHLPPK